jgi:DNA-binding NarL/FixJ family response regulator
MFMSPSPAKHPKRFASTPPTKPTLAARVVLDEREQCLLRHLAQGLLYKEIEDRMKISHSVLRRLQKRVYRKLHAANRTEAINRWLHPEFPAPAHLNN